MQTGALSSSSTISTRRRARTGHPERRAVAERNGLQQRNSRLAQGLRPKGPLLV